jgi:DNA polymerase
MDALAALRLQIEWGADEALDHSPIDRLASVSALPVAAVAPRSPAVLRAATPASPPAARAQDLADAAESIEALRTALMNFDGCALRTTATQLVFADGNGEAGLMFVGEAPGAEEDRAGLPFVGASGQLFDRMVASIGLDRSRFLITNVIPWRPPGNRTPNDGEVAACLPFLLRQIALRRPKRVVLLGSLATAAVTGNPAGIRKLRGRWLAVTVRGMEQPVPMLPTYHPAYLLRTPAAKRETLADLLTLRTALDADRS